MLLILLQGILNRSNTGSLNADKVIKTMVVRYSFDTSELEKIEPILNKIEV
jgi:hypothetical protein